jgi:pyrimidine-nucleoside phosphorylase
MRSMPELIARKRDGGELAPDEVRWIIARYTADDIPDYQMSALLMTFMFRGMTPDELNAWTDAMLHSGDVLDLSASDAGKVDKHSTGGVGDKISIPLGPLVAACGVAVPMVSGRGLGHTGGTLDKLESIPGFSPAVSPRQFVRQLEQLGLVFAGQTETLVPADRRIYALRDASGSVPSIPLISSSIMSKKLAEDLDGLVLDVKVGSGAFMKERTEAEELAGTMVEIGAAHGTTVVALLTDMDQPLGAAVGNANEIIESIAVLRGDGPADVHELTMRLGEQMLLLGGVADNRSSAREQLDEALQSGAARERFRDVITYQGGNPNVIDDPGLLPTAAHSHVVAAQRDGYVTSCDALAIGRASVLLGAGRQRKEDAVDPAVGIMLHAKRGAAVDVGSPLATVAYNDAGRLEAALPLLTEAWSISDQTLPSRELIIGEVR